IRNVVGPRLLTLVGVVTSVAGVVSFGIVVFSAVGFRVVVSARPFVSASVLDCVVSVRAVVRRGGVRCPTLRFAARPNGARAGVLSRKPGVYVFGSFVWVHTQARK